MSLEELRGELERRSKELLAHEIEELPTTLRHLVQENSTKLLLAALGFQESFGRWEVNRTGGNSPMASALGACVMQALQLAIPDFIKEYITDLTRTELLQEAGRRDFKHQLHRGTLDRVHTWIDEEAKVQSQKIIATLKQPETK